MTDVVISRLLFEVGVRPEYDGKSNVVQRVRWGLSFEKDGFIVLSYFETFLTLGDLNPFTPIGNLSKAQVLDWAYQHENGDEFIAKNLPFQEQQLQYAKLQAENVDYPNFPVDPPIRPIPEIQTTAL
jgi:hypothetical protein